MFVEVYIAFSIVYLSKYFVGIELNLLRIVQLANIISLDLVFHHFIYHFLSSLKNLSDIHIHVNTLKHGLLSVNLLDVD